MRRIIAAAALLAAIGLLVVGQAARGSGDYLVRGIFDNGGFLVPGEDVRVAGATVGSVSSVDVTRPGEAAHRDGSPDPGKAVVVMNITDPGVQDFRRDASCLIRPQSLLGEKYVDCKPTQPRAPGRPLPPRLRVVPNDQPGAGERFLPLENNGKEVDLDLVNNIMRAPSPDRFRLILNDLGAGLAARGETLEAIVKRANPALRQTDRVLAVIARQRHVLSRLAADADAVLTPLARERQHVASFINGADVTAQAAAERRPALEAGLRDLPSGLRELHATATKLRSFSAEATPLFSQLRAGAPSITRATEALGPFAHAATPALTTLGTATRLARRPLVSSDPILVKLRDLARKAAPGAGSLNRLLASLRKTGGYRLLTEFIYNTVGSINGYDRYGHFLRAGLQVTSCTTLVTTPLPSCEAHFSASKATAAAVNLNARQHHRTARPGSDSGLTVRPAAARQQPRDALGQGGVGATMAPGGAARRGKSRRRRRGTCSTR